MLVSVEHLRFHLHHHLPVADATHVEPLNVSTSPELPVIVKLSDSTAVPCNVSA